MIAINLVLLVFLGWHQTMMLAASERYGLDPSWSESLFYFLAFAAVDAGAAFAAFKRHYGVAIPIAACLVALLALGSLLVLGGVGM